MIKKLLGIAMIFITAEYVNAQAFTLSYQFTSVTPSTGVVDPTPTATVTGVNSGSWTAVGTGSASSGSAYFSFTGWGTGATNGDNSNFTGSIDLTKYYQLSLTAQPSYVFSLDKMTFGASRSGTGVRHWAVRTDRDNYTANIAATYTALNAAASASSAPLITIQNGDTFFWKDDAFSTSVAGAGAAFNNICQVTFTGSPYTNQTSYNIRVYAWNAEGSGGTFRIDTAMVFGTATFSLGTNINKVSHDMGASFRLYPNPATYGVAYIESSLPQINKIEVLNALGQVVSIQNAFINASRAELKLSELPTGYYFVRITSKEAVYTEKLLITK